MHVAGIIRKTQESGKKRDINGYKLHKSGKKTRANSLGQYHRIDGTAMEYADGTKYYCYKDKQISKEIYLSDEFQVKIILEG